MNIQELKEKSSEKLIAEAEDLGIENASTLRRQEIYFAILKKLAEKGEEITGGGVLQLLQDGFGFLRAMESKSITTSFLCSVNLLAFSITISATATCL